MKAIYEILFMVKREPGNLSDTRRVVGEASTKGFKRVVAWAESVCDDEEVIGAVKIVTTEKL